MGWHCFSTSTNTSIDNEQVEISFQDCLFFTPQAFYLSQSGTGTEEIILENLNLKLGLDYFISPLDLLRYLASLNWNIHLLFSTNLTSNVSNIHPNLILVNSLDNLNQFVHSSLGTNNSTAVVISSTSTTRPRNLAQSQQQQQQQKSKQKQKKEGQGEAGEASTAGDAATSTDVVIFGADDKDKSNDEREKVVDFLQPESMNSNEIRLLVWSSKASPIKAVSI